MLYVRGNNCDTDDAEYYVNHLMVAVLRELDGDTLYCIIVQSRTTMAASYDGMRRDCVRKIIK